MNIYTDGSCLGNPGRGGYAFVMVKKNEVISVTGSNPNTTNNRMELLAVIEALECTDPLGVTIYTDSSYVSNGCTKWLAGWKKNCWKKSDGKPVLNVDLWKRMDKALNKGRDLKFVWVKAHNGNTYNELADKLAREAASSL